MQTRRKLSFLGGLILGLSLAMGYAAADTSADKKSKKGKPGDTCKSDSDCDQSQPQTCSGSKCQGKPMPPPPT